RSRLYDPSLVVMAAVRTLYACLSPTIGSLSPDVLSSTAPVHRPPRTRRASSTTVWSRWSDRRRSCGRRTASASSTSRDVCAADFGHLPSIDDTPPFLGPELGTETQSARNYVQTVIGLAGRMERDPSRGEPRHG